MICSGGGGGGGRCSLGRRSRLPAPYLRVCLHGVVRVRTVHGGGRGEAVPTLARPRKLISWAPPTRVCNRAFTPPPLEKWAKAQPAGGVVRISPAAQPLACHGRTAIPRRGPPVPIGHFRSIHSHCSGTPSLQLFPLLPGINSIPTTLAGPGRTRAALQRIPRVCGDWRLRAVEDYNRGSQTNKRREVPTYGALAVCSQPVLAVCSQLWRYAGAQWRCDAPPVAASRAAGVFVGAGRSRCALGASAAAGVARTRLPRNGWGLRWQQSLRELKWGPWFAPRTVCCFARVGCVAGGWRQTQVRTPGCLGCWAGFFQRHLQRGRPTRELGTEKGEKGPRARGFPGAIERGSKECDAGPVMAWLRGWGRESAAPQGPPATGGITE